MLSTLPGSTVQADRQRSSVHAAFPPWLAMGAVLVAVAASAQDAPPALPDDVVASVASRVITRRELELAAEARLAPIRAAEYDILREVLDGLIRNELLSREAGARATSVPDLLRRNVDDHVPAASPLELEGALEFAGSRYAGLDRPAALSSIEKALRARRTERRRAEYERQLAGAYDVTVYLQPRRKLIQAGSSQSQGPASAAVTIVEFSDYQCPFCRQSARVLAEVLRRHPLDVRLVVKSFPLPSHAQADWAASAAQCAAEQGKFWEAREWLLENQESLAEETAQDAMGRSIGLYPERLTDCMQEGRGRAGWRSDVDLAKSLGVQNTPTLFVNGRMRLGLQTLQQLEDIVEEELRWAKDAQKRLRAESSRRVTGSRADRK